MFCFLFFLGKVSIVHSESCAAQNEEANVIYVMDSSGSVSDADYDVGIDFIKSSYGPGVPAGSRTSLITFSNDIDERWGLNDRIDTIEKFSRRIDTETERTQASGTKLAIALDYSINILRYLSGGRVIVVITDGKPNSIYEVCVLQAAIASHGITTFVVGISDGYDPQVGECLTDASHTFHVDDYNHLSIISAPFNDMLCKDVGAIAHIIFHSEIPDPENLGWVGSNVIPKVIDAIPNLDQVDVVITVTITNYIILEFPRVVSNDDIRKAIYDVCEAHSLCRHEDIIRPIDIFDNYRRALQGTYEIQADLKFEGTDLDVPQLSATQGFLYNEFEEDFKQYTQVHLNTEVEDLQFDGSFLNMTIELKGNRVYDDGSSTVDLIDEVIIEFLNTPSRAPTSALPSALPSAVPTTTTPTSFPSSSPTSALPSAIPTTATPTSFPSSSAPSATTYERCEKSNPTRILDEAQCQDAADYFGFEFIIVNYFARTQNTPGCVQPLGLNKVLFNPNLESQRSHDWQVPICPFQLDEPIRIEFIRHISEFIWKINNSTGNPTSSVPTTPPSVMPSSYIPSFQPTSGSKINKIAASPEVSETTCFTIYIVALTIILQILLS